MDVSLYDYVRFNKKFYLYDMEHKILYNSMVLDDPIGVS